VLGVGEEGRGEVWGSSLEIITPRRELVVGLSACARAFSEPSKDLSEGDGGKYHET
jgi:hypothetical protein